MSIAPPAKWSDNRALLPASEEIVEALKDHGKPEKVGKKGGVVMRHTLLSKMAAGIYSNLLKTCPKHDSMDTNISRGKDATVQA